MPSFNQLCWTLIFHCWIYLSLDLLFFVLFGQKDLRQITVILRSIAYVAGKGVFVSQYVDESREM